MRMPLLLTLSIFIIVILIVVLLMIFVPKNKKFYPLPFDQNEMLESFAFVNDKPFFKWKECKDTLVLDETKKEPGVVLPEKKFYKFDIYTGNKINKKFAKACPNIYELVKNIKNVKNAFIGKVIEKSTLKIGNTRKELSNTTLRCVLPIICSGDVSKCGIWVDWETKPFNNSTWICFDHSKQWTIYNKTDEDQIYLIVDVVRPDNVPFGVAF